jgi:hypothetical protein
MRSILFHGLQQGLQFATILPRWKGKGILDFARMTVLVLAQKCATEDF